MNQQPFVEIHKARLPDDIDLVRQLWTDYLTWGNDNMQLLYGVHPHHPEKQVEEDIRMIDKFMPPDGRLLLAFMDNKPCGIGCLKKISKEIGEIKRMYVNPSYRKMGIGRSLLQSLIEEAKKSGYRKLRLDSLRFMVDAHALYRNFRFTEIPVYSEVEIPEAFRQYLLFMELDLTA